MESKSNRRDPDEVDAQQIRDRFGQAQEAFSRAKEGASKATACLWFVLDETRGDLGTEWLQSEMAARGRKIAEDNDELEELRNRVRKHGKALLKEDEYKGPEERAQLEALLSRTKEEWAAIRKLPIN